MDIALVYLMRGLDFFFLENVVSLLVPLVLKALVLVWLILGGLVVFAWVIVFCVIVVFAWVIVFCVIVVLAWVIVFCVIVILAVVMVSDILVVYTLVIV